MFIVSHIKLVFIRLSRGDDDDKDGHILTSISQGFRYLSIRISKPYISQ